MELAIQKYLDSYTQICPELTADELDFIKRNLTITHLEKKEFYLEEGRIQREMGFVFSGILRSYYIDNNGKDITIAFDEEETYAADYPSFIEQKPSRYYIQCIEPCTMVNLPHAAIQQAYKEFKGFEKYGRLIAEAILIKNQKRIESFLFENAEERYLDFIDNNRVLMNRISLTHLCSYLGIERQSLSRIRKKLQEK